MGIGGVRFKNVHFYFLTKKMHHNGTLTVDKSSETINGIIEKYKCMCKSIFSKHITQF